MIRTMMYNCQEENKYHFNDSPMILRTITDNDDICSYVPYFNNIQLQ